MLTLQDAGSYWRYCLSIEQMLNKTTDYVEICSNNSSTYSFEYAKIIMLACSELDVMFRLLCKEIDSGLDFENSSTRSGNIALYAQTILPKFPKITTFALKEDRSLLDFIPFSNWCLSPYSSPSWWDDYQKVKHYRHSEFMRATQDNALNAVAGLITLNFYLYRQIANQPYANPPHPSSHMFSSAVFAPMMRFRADEELPDFMVTP